MEHRPHNVTAFPNEALAVVLDTDFSVSSTIYVGVAGNVSVVTAEGGNTVVFTVPAGGVVPVRVKRVNTSGTTASGLVRVW